MGSFLLEMACCEPFRMNLYLQVPIIVLGNMTDVPGRQVDTDFAVNWAAREKGIFSVRAPSKDQVEKFVLRCQRDFCLNIKLCDACQGLYCLLMLVRFQSNYMR